ncbi:MAG TPA: alpha/beta fold hydrolase [Streptosporangiaceae bacterium]|jgi:polyhydroxyalkanoate synthase|nr:alpha/beta fold hydrolase [Streptosporangiaceae bacterium]
MTENTSHDRAQDAAFVLAPETDLLAQVDMAGLGRALGQVFTSALANPAAASEAGLRYWAALAQIPAVALSSWLGRPIPPPVDLNPRDKRFADKTWAENPAFYSLRLSHQAFADLMDRLVAVAGLEPTQEAKARLVAGLAVDALAPTNYLPTNPAALKRAFETGGASVVKGLRNMVDDVLHNNGRPRQVDTSGFTLGQNLAATPGQAVFRNDLMELLQYSPQTDQVHATPMMCSPPWINKYYVMDLAPERSFIEWAVQHERTVFAISYRNPSPDMSGVTLEDYLIHGPRQALDVIQDITGAPVVDIVGLCLGGALTAITDAYLAASGDDRIGTITLLNTLLDYSEPGVLGAFTDAETVSRLEAQMEREGGLSASAMAGTFDMLRANDLIFSYVASNWLMGQDPPAFDILAWNADSTRMPAAMHAFYLRNFYMQNNLAQGKLQLAGRKLNLGDVKHPAYVVSAENDHIVPWKSAYATTSLVSGPVKFVLSNGGHIAGIVNPPGPKGWYLAGEKHPKSADKWREKATKHAGSWWQDWANWSAENSGPLTDPPPTGSDTYPALYAAPGRYVFE